MEDKVLIPRNLHLISALAAIVLALGVLAFETVTAQSLEDQYVHVLAPLFLPRPTWVAHYNKPGFNNPTC